MVKSSKTLDGQTHRLGNVSNALQPGDDLHGAIVDPAAFNDLTTSDVAVHCAVQGGGRELRCRRDVGSVDMAVQDMIVEHRSDQIGRARVGVRSQHAGGGERTESLVVWGEQGKVGPAGDLGRDVWEGGQ